MSAQVGAPIEVAIEDLYKIEGKAEIINGEIVPLAATGHLPNRIAGNVYISLRAHERNVPGGYAVGDNMAFSVDLPHRESFSPDAAFCFSEPTMKFVEGAPAFAVEVRSEGDYGARAERRMQQKRADYFAAGTLVVWDVDLLSGTPVESYSADAPDAPRVFRRGETADAEPAVPGWRIAVDDLFV